MGNQQRTVKSTAKFSGIGLHSGELVEVEIRPAPANTGIVFVREDLPSRPYIKATPENVFDTTLATRIGTPDAFISTIEHLMSAFFGLGIDNAIVGVNSYELPIVDGSAAPFLVLLDEAGVVELAEPRKVLVIKEAIEIVDPRNSSRFIRIEPSKKPFISYSIDFENAEAIGRQQASMEFSGVAFCEQLAFARTFCLAEEVEYMQSRGLARGGSLDNAIVVSRKEGILNLHGLRSDTEFVRHKMLDCIGDLALVGMPILGHVIAHKAGHDLHTQLAKVLMTHARSHEVLVPGRRDVSLWKELLAFPKSLSDVPSLGLGTLVRG